jgi:hypothetical protein
MRRLAAVVLFALTALPLFAAGKSTRIVIRDGDSTYMTGDFDSSSDARYDNAAGGRHYAWFERDGESWLITDPAVLAQLRDATRAQRGIGSDQGALGSRQAELGRRQAELGRKQAELGREEAASAVAGDRDRQREFSAKQRDLSEQQRALSEKQRELSGKQRELSAKQREVSRQVQRNIEKIFEDAMRSGVAKRR